MLNDFNIEIYYIAVKMIIIYIIYLNLSIFFNGNGL